MGKHDLINSFLSFGYIPGPNLDIHANIVDAVSQTQVGTNQNYSKQTGVEILGSIFDDRVRNYDESTTHVIGLSGGYDSRTVLGGVLENTDPDNVITFSYGSPGTLDFELGAEVANKAGVEFHRFDTRTGNINSFEDRYRKSARTNARPTSLFNARDAVRYALDELDLDEYVFWSGFMGGELAGGHLPEEKSESWSSAINTFLARNYSIPELASEDFDPRSMLPNEPLLDESELSYNEQLDFGIRQPHYIRQIVACGDKIEFPYLDSRWLTYILNAPRDLRVNRSLYTSVVQAKFPDLFSTKTKVIPEIQSVGDLWGKMENRILDLPNYIKRKFDIPAYSNSTNYFDPSFELETQPEFEEFAGEMITDLRNRNIIDWIEFDNLYKDGAIDSGKGSMIERLVCLEIYLKEYGCLDYWITPDMEYKEP